MGFPILVKLHLYIESEPCSLPSIYCSIHLVTRVILYVEVIGVNERWNPGGREVHFRFLLYKINTLSGPLFTNRKISWSLEAARFGFKLLQWLWNLAGTSAALLPRYLSNFRAIRPLQHPISRLRDFTRFGGKTSYRLVNRGPVYYFWWSSTSYLSFFPSAVLM